MDYNGWSNKPTWLVNLWFGDNFEMEREEGGTVDADYIQNFVEEIGVDNMTAQSDFTSDLLTYVLAEVNWQELAEHYKD